MDLDGFPRGVPLVHGFLGGSGLRGRADGTSHTHEQWPLADSPWHSVPLEQLSSYMYLSELGASCKLCRVKKLP